ncbi:MAG: hypothetical protein FWF66_07545 [Candidatus Bathyarchaeota archaeon]|nr:hypothetical protein [Candidatus Termiticorpusculum sp.]MCL1971287.1 hypothetical protein [Candidatus Termiticorpusculum sp.]
MRKHKSTWKFVFDGFAESGFFSVNMLNVTFPVVSMLYFRIIGLNMRQVYTSYSNFNVSCNYIDEVYGAENVEFGGLMQSV